MPSSKGNHRGGFASMRSLSMSARSKLGNPKTKSEIWFEEYLNAHAYRDWTHEEPVPGKATTPDYCLTVDGKPVYLDVKEFEPQPGSPGFSVFNPYTAIREKINKAARQFKHYKEHSCSVVLANPHGTFVILEEYAVRGAMFGDVGFRFQVCLPPGQQPDIQNVFRHHGKLLYADRDRENYRIQNTTFGAVIVLDRYPIRKRLIEIDHKQRKKYGDAAGNANLLNDIPKYEEQPLRVSVYENPFATIPFPSDIFRGPYDERWGIEDNFHLRTFAGVEVEKLDAEYQKLS